MGVFPDYEINDDDENQELRAQDRLSRDSSSNPCLIIRPCISRPISYSLL